MNGGTIRRSTLAGFIACTALTAMLSPISAAPAPAAPPAPPAPIMPPSLPPTYTVDLMTPQGTAAFAAQWKTMDAKIVEAKPVDGAMAQYKTTYDIAPHAGEAGFDDSKWPAIAGKDLSVRRSGGHVAFVWYRTNLTIPAKVGDFDTTGAKAVLTVLVDDYAEVWVNGQMPRQSGYPSPATIQGLNMPNRVVLADSSILLDYMLAKFTWVMEGLVVRAERMRQNLDASQGLPFSGRVLLALVEAGLSREDAYVVVQRNALQAWETGEHLRDLVLADPDAQGLDAAVIERAFSLDDVLARAEVPFGRLG